LLLFGTKISDGTRTLQPHLCPPGRGFGLPGPPRRIEGASHGGVQESWRRG